MIICVDFDGTLCQSKYPGLGYPVPGAVRAMQELHDAGHYLIIWSSRCGAELLAAINYLLEHKIPFDRVNDHCPDNVKKYGNGGNKVYADVYIDDHNVGGFPGWKATLELIRKQLE